ncbi:MAG: CcdB family protein [Hyphomicrobium sp.]|nr:CcdB family protein [Hyphomicrobium sp.]
MARFDVYRLEGFQHYVVDVQADILRDLRTRIVVPLVALREQQSESSARLRPRLTISGTDYLLNTPELAAVPCSRLAERVASLNHQHETIVDALDFLMQGF